MAINLPIVSKFDDAGVKKANGAFDGMGKKLAILGGAVAGAFSVAAITNFAKEATLAAEAISTSGARIDQVAKSMGVFGTDVDAVTQRLKDYAAQNELLLATDENVIMETQAKLLTFKELATSADQMGGAFDRATQLSIDLAAAGFGAAETNAVQLGKALNDPVTGISALTRVGLTFTEAEKDKIKALQESGDTLGAQELILKALETQVGGVARATADMSVQMGLAFGEVKEGVGAALLPAFNEFGVGVIRITEMILPPLQAFLSEKLAPALMTGASLFTEWTINVSEFGFSFSGLMRNLSEGVMNFVGEGGLAALFTKLMEMRQNFTEALLEALPGIIEAFVTFLPMLLDFIATTVLPALIESFTTVLKDVIEVFVTVLPMMVEALLGMIPDLLKAAIDTFTALVDAVADILPILVKAITDLMPDLVTAILKMLPDILKAAVDLFTALVDALPKILPVLISAVFALLPQIIDTFVKMAPKLIEGAITLFTGITTGLLRATPKVLGEVAGLIPKMVTSLLNNVPKLVTAGIDIVRGLASGIINNAPRLLGEAINSLGNTLVNGVKGFLGISSPSKVFIGIGDDVVKGLETGLEDGKGLLASASVDMAQTLKVSAQDALAAPSRADTRPVVAVPSAGGSGSNVTYSINVNAGMGTDGNRVGQMIVDEIIKFERTSGRVFARA